MIIIMFGPPAAGKGSVAGILSEKYNIPTISTGDMFRKYISNGSEIGKKANEYISQGQLVPDEITIEMVKERLSENDVKNGFILDGFPRTVKQAEELDKFLKENNRDIDVVVKLEAPKEELLERITNRRICKNSDCKAVYNTKLNPPKVAGICDKCGGPIVQRDDDKLESALNRLSVYDKETAPVADYYKGTERLYTTTLSERENRLKDVVSADIIKYLDLKKKKNNGKRNIEDECR